MEGYTGIAIGCLQVMYEEEQEAGYPYVGQQLRKDFVVAWFFRDACDAMRREYTRHGTVTRPAKIW